MKILLLGEFSSFHRYLKEGLQAFPGVDVTLASNGDGWKKIPGSDVSLFNQGKGFFSSRCGVYVSSLINARAFKNYDVVQFINPRLYPTLLNAKIIDYIIKNVMNVNMEFPEMVKKRYVKKKKGKKQ